jgi:hypothetical protein
MMIMVIALANLITAPVNVRHQPQFNGCGHKEPSVSSVWPNVLFYYFCTNSNTNAGKQHIIVALSGNALLKQGPRHAAMENQQDNISSCMASLASVRDYKSTLVHETDLQVGLLVLEVPHTKKKLV